MPIDWELFRQESENLAKCLYQGIDLARAGQYDRAVEIFTDAIISAGRLMQKDPAIGRSLKLDKTILVLKGYQLKAYAHKMSGEPENAGQIAQEMKRIARGPVSRENPYFAEISKALDEWEQGNFYTRPRED